MANRKATFLLVPFYLDGNCDIGTYICASTEDAKDKAEEIAEDYSNNGLRFFIVDVQECVLMRGYPVAKVQRINWS